jgi:hypothetical protein
MNARRSLAAPWRVLMVGLTAAALVAVVAGVRAAAVAVPAAAATAATPGAAPAAQVVPQQPVRRPAGQAALGCERCHGELELLRQQTGSLARAREALVPEHVVAASAHGDMSCARCHTGYARYPHDERGTRTETCASCHVQADSLWQRSTHATADDEVTCVQCHSSHDVKSAETLSARHGAALANAPCATCHEAARLEQHAPHADSVSCAACHAPHAVRPVDDPDSWLAPARQARTCAACHDTIAQVSRSDIHGDAELRAAHLGDRAPAADVVVCTSCHIGHAMIATDDPRFAAVSVERCASCHEDANRTFFKSYHGRATALGSRVAASCADCHGAHTILPDTFMAARVAPANLVDTCGECHEKASPAFVKYDTHPDPFNRARNPWIFYSFVLMNGLLIFVLTVFGAHTLLWWLRLWLDKRRGIVHGIGVHSHHAEPGAPQGEGGTA